MKIPGFLAFVLLLSGCVKEELAPGGGSADGTTHIALSIGDAELFTRSEASENECKIDDAYLLLFDAAGKYKTGEKVLASQISGADIKAPVITTRLDVENGNKIVVLLNTNVSSLPSGLTPGVTAMSAINRLFPASGWSLNSSYEDTFGRGMPMSGETTYVLNTTPTVQIRRSVAKIQLKLDIAPGDDVTNSFDNSLRWGMYNVLKPGKGALFAPGGAITTADGLMAYGDFEDRMLDKTPLAVGLNYEQTFYMPEYASASKAKEAEVSATAFARNRTCLIVQTGSSSYYRIDLYDRAAQKFIDIRRNMHIVVTIKRVKSPGYTTAIEALADFGGNLEYEIKVEGENDNIVISNGQYALSLEYDEVIYTGDTSTEVSFGDIRFIGSAGVGLPAINYITASSNVTLTGIRSVSATPQELKARIISGTGTMSGTITVSLGQIKKEIKLICGGTAIPASGGVMTTGSYFGARWFHKDEGFEITANGTVVTCDENVTPTNSTELSDPAVVPEFTTRSAEGDILRAGTDPGRTKISIVQAAPECVGWLGGDPDNSYGRYSKRLIIDSHRAPSALLWYINTNVDTKITNNETGLDNTKALMTQSDPENYQAARYCYMLNDRNGNGMIDADEPVNWYLPARDQLVSVWVVYNGLTPWSFGDTNLEYWSSTDYRNSACWAVRFSGGQLIFWNPKNTLRNVRCVRDL